MAYIFQKLAQKGYQQGLVSNKDILDAREWFRDEASNIKSVNSQQMMKTGVSGSPAMGSMYMFFYDPKYKKTLPYYDRFPLVISNQFLFRWFSWNEPSLHSTGIKSYIDGSSVFYYK